MATAATQNELPADVVTYLRRALPHFIAGKSVEEAMRAVLDDDARLATAYARQASHSYFPTPCERGRSVRSSEQVGDVIGSQLSAQVYASLRQAA